MHTEKDTTYVNIIFDIPTFRGVMVEKFKSPTTFVYASNLQGCIWKDKDGQIHSFNGMPGEILIIEQQKCRCKWYKHGEFIKEIEIVKKLEHELIAEKIKIRNFNKRIKNVSNSNKRHS